MRRCIAVPHLREQILSRAGTDALLAQTDLRFTGVVYSTRPTRDETVDCSDLVLSVRTTADHFERGDLRNSVFTAKATAIGGVIGTVFGMCIKQRLASRLREAARSDADRIGPDSSPAARLAARTDATKIAQGEVPGAPVLAGMLFGTVLGATYHSIFGKLD